MGTRRSSAVTVGISWPMLSSVFGAAPELGWKGVAGMGPPGITRRTVGAAQVAGGRPVNFFGDGERDPYQFALTTARCSSREVVNTSRAASAFMAAMPSPTMRSG